MRQWNSFWDLMWKAGCHSIGPDVTLIYQNPQQKYLDDQSIAIFNEYKFAVVDEASAKVAWEEIQQKKRREQGYQCIVL